MVLSAVSHCHTLHITNEEKIKVNMPGLEDGTHNSFPCDTVLGSIGISLCQHVTGTVAEINC